MRDPLWNNPTHFIYQYIRKRMMKMTVISNVNQTLSTIKSIEAQLSIFALNSQEKNAQQTFHEMMIVMNEIKEDLQKRTIEMKLEEPQYKN
jgi:hypothetical protein